MGLREKFWKTEEEKFADKHYELLQGIQAIGQYVENLEDQQNKIRRQMRNARAAEDTEMFAELNTDFDENDMAGKYFGKAGRQLERAVTRLEGEALGKAIEGVIEEYLPIAQQQGNRTMITLLTRLQKNEWARRYFTKGTIRDIPSKTTELKGSALTRWEEMGREVVTETRDAESLADKLKAKGVE